MNDQANDKRSPIIAVALIITVGLLVVFGWLLSRTRTCPEGWWFWDRLTCLEPNALGDTFAGAFAPVAFVWLVAAVLLQRNELAAQRQELREARAVAEAQVAEARRKVELIAEQTAIIKKAREDEEQAETEREIDGIIAIFRDRFTRDFHNIAVVENDRRQQESGIDAGFGVQRGQRSGDDYTVVAACISDLERSFKSFKANYEDSVISVRIDTDNFAAVFAFVTEIEDVIDRVSSRKLNQLNHMGFWGLTFLIREIYEYLGAHTPSWKDGVNEDFDMRKPQL